MTTTSLKPNPDSWVKGMPMVPAVPFTNCPIATSLGVLGKKWTILIIRDMAMRKMERFSELLKGAQGITPRVLSQRLKELEGVGMIERVENAKSPKLVRWNLTDKGWDTVPVLMAYTAFGSKWYASTVVEDGIPREMKQVYPQRELEKYYVNLEVTDQFRKASQQQARQNSWSK